MTDNTDTETDAYDTVTAGDIAEFLHHLADLRYRPRNDDPAERAAVLNAGKAELFTRIADQSAISDPSYAQQVQQLATDALTAAADVNPALTPPTATP